MASALSMVPPGDDVWVLQKLRALRIRVKGAFHCTVDKTHQVAVTLCRLRSLTGGMASTQAGRWRPAIPGASIISSHARAGFLCLYLVPLSLSVLRWIVEQSVAIEEVGGQKASPSTAALSRFSLVSPGYAPTGPVTADLAH